MITKFFFAFSSFLKNSWTFLLLEIQETQTILRILIASTLIRSKAIHFDKKFQCNQQIFVSCAWSFAVWNSISSRREEIQDLLMKFLSFCVFVFIAQTILGQNVREMKNFNGFINEFPDTRSLKQQISRLPSTSPLGVTEVTENFENIATQSLLIAACPKTKVLIDGRCRPKQKLIW